MRRRNWRWYDDFIVEERIYSSSTREQWEQIWNQLQGLFPPFPPKPGRGRTLGSESALFPDQQGTMGTGF